MPTYRLDLEYDGTRYSGWQEQRNTGRTVAGVLRAAVEATGARILDLGGSGRTDAGVHALSQVAHLRLAAAIVPEPFRRQVDDALPADVHLAAVAPAKDRFHSRHDALLRTYLYQVSTRRTAFAKRWVWWVRDPLDLEAMRAAAALLPGRHDFARFCERPGEQSSTVVVVDSVQLARDGDLVLLRLTASHFLWRMVRRLVGSLVEVGAGRLPLERFTALLAADPRAPESPAEWTAPSSGLFLERVQYPDEPPPGELCPAVPVGSRTAGAERYVGGKGASRPPRSGPGRPGRPGRPGGSGRSGRSGRGPRYG